MKAPFPYFGGKAMVAADVWDALGQPAHYIEPFFGSGAVLLNRPNYDMQAHIETVNDKDGFIANVWRSIQYSPEETAKVCDWPVNHADLIARKARLIREEKYLLDNLCKDEKWHDIELAGYWIWAASCWIGSGLTRPGAIPRIADTGAGVHMKGKRPHLSEVGMGVHAKGQRPHLSDKGMGVHMKGQQGGIYDWFDALSARLRRVRVVCGDWTRVCGGDWQDNFGAVGMFFDPPYGIEDRDTAIYHHDSTSIAADVKEWVKERGAREKYRIVLAGYEEYQELVDKYGWTQKAWKANGGYANTQRNDDSEVIGKENAKREILYFSPYCIGARQLTFFD